MDKTITREDFASSADRIIADVRNGETYVVTENGKPVAQISRHPSASLSAEELARREVARQKLLEHLHNQPARNLGPWSREEGYL